MFNGHPEIARRAQDALEASGLLEQVDEISHATKLTVRSTLDRAVMLVFNTGTIVVQGRPSETKTWLEEVAKALRTGRQPPECPWPDSEPQQESEAPESALGSSVPFD